MLERNDPAITREASAVASQMLSRPDNMVVWLKFDAEKIPINSADNEILFLEHGAPKRLPKDRGLYRNWGAFFDFNDVLELPSPLLFPTAEWSISFWTLLPLSYLTGKRHTLV